ncbi:unnamed protein product [Cyprideis torosa]|uniref:Uncharacterized protein n=1 Tax=Cyprideis torosa TaxID=163714 RepID=A0A7R8W0Q9_9CRUS|nr:unnamed protein product [Cyprideis torosa]CAG0879027.1 unnamed protein product [Cyprideis torosa]
MSGMLDGVIDFTGGTTGAIASVYVGQPLDTVKVKMQSFPATYRSGMFHCFATTYKQDGIFRGLYAGTTPALVANIAENSVLFLAYGFCQKLVGFVRGKTVATLSPFDNACAGTSAAFFAAFTLCPTELIKCRLQALRELTAMGTAPTPVGISRWGPFSLTRHILSVEGIPGLFKGLVPTMAREMFGYFFFFGGYEMARYLMTPPGKTKDEIGVVRTVIAGGFGGVCLWTVIFPVDVVKSRVQVSGNSMNLIRTIKQIAVKEGGNLEEEGEGEI